MQELRLVAVSEDGTYLVLATAGRGTRFTLPVDDRLRAAVRGNFSRLGQYEIEVESPLRPKEIQARIRAGETAEEIAATAGIPVERVRWFEGPVLQEREYMAQQAQRCAVRLPGEAAARPTLGELVAERLTRRGVPADEIDWDSCKRDDNLWRIKLGYVWNGHTRHAEWLFDPRRRHVSPYDDEAMRLSADDYVEPQAEEATVRPFVPRIAGKLAPVPPRDYDYDLAEPPPLRVAPTGNLPDHFSPRFTPDPAPAAFHEPEPPRAAPSPYQEPRYAEPQVSAPASYATPEPQEPRHTPPPQ
ncbi:septation protein SepH, partial [Herbidospora yilanensis]|uniref:septation protein SepH n=1 Tax=Herbidospora yilanensis TaxID=354426 RepID=UPI000AB61037